MIVVGSEVCSTGVVGGGTLGGDTMWLAVVTRSSVEEKVFTACGRLSGVQVLSITVIVHSHTLHILMHSTYKWILFLSNNLCWKGDHAK